MLADQYRVRIRSTLDDVAAKGEEATPPAEPAEGPGPNLVFVVIVVAVVAPLVSWALQAGSAGWQPIGDDAVIGVRAEDVFTRHPPLLGMPSSFSEWTEADPNHPGPMIFWTMAPAITLFGRTPMALLMSVLAVNAASVVGIITIARRRLGSHGALLAAVFLLPLLFSLGSEPYQPLNPILAVLPFTLAIYCAWAVVLHDDVWLPVGVVSASFAIQADLAYAVPGAALLIGMVAIALVRSLHARRAARIDRSTRPFVIGALLLVGCWTLPGLEVLAHGGESNPGELLAAVRTAGLSVTGLSFIKHAFVSAANGAWAVSIDPDNFDASLSMWGLGFVLVWIGALAWAVRRRAHQAWAPMAMATAMLAVCAWTVSRTPADAGIDSFYVLPLAPVGMFLWFATAAIVVQMAASRMHHLPDVVRLRGTAVLRALAGLLVLGMSAAQAVLIDRVEKSSVERGEWASVADVASQLDRLPSGTYEIRPLGGPSATALQHGVIFALDSERHRLVVESGLTKYLGPEHSATVNEKEVRGLLYFIVGPPGSPPVPEARLVAQWDPPGIKPGSVRALEEEVATVFGAGEVVLDSEASDFFIGQAMAATGAGGQVDEFTEEDLRQLGQRVQADPDVLLGSPDSTIVALYDQGMIAAPTLPTELDQELQSTIAADWVSVYLVPVPAGGRR